MKPAPPIKNQRPAVFTERQEQTPQQGPGVETLHASHRDVQPRSVIDDAEHDMLPAVSIGDASRVDAPHMVARFRFRQMMLEFLLPMQRFIRLFLEQFAHPGAAY